MKHVNVLVFPCGSEVGLELNRALGEISFITLFGASSVSDHGKFVFRNYDEGLPYVSDPTFVDRFNDVLRRRKIDYVYPAMDEVVDLLSANRDRLAAELIAPGDDAVKTCRNKARTYRRLDGLYFLPRVFPCPDDVKEYPVAVKPEEGYGARGFHVARNRIELDGILKMASSPCVVCEYLPGTEYTIDCFTDRKGVLSFVSSRSRDRIRTGISVRSSLRPVPDDIRRIAEEISARIHMRGAWFFQLKKNGAGDYRLLEVATRIAGTMGLERGVGVNLPLLSVCDWMGLDVRIEPQFHEAVVDRALCNVYSLPVDFDEVYVDFDDTLIVHGRVNGMLMAYLYQCKDRGIPIRMITKHDSEIRADLALWSISESLFDEIVQIPKSARKIDFMRPGKNAVFIDDSFAERSQVHAAFGIAAFGVESVECLLDHRV